MSRAEGNGKLLDRVLNAELWLAGRLRDHGVAFDPFEGLTDAPDRRERFRQAILANGLSTVMAGRRGGKAESYAQVFERLYGRAL